MEDYKAKEFFEGVLSKTRAGRIRWQATAVDSEYIAAIGGVATFDGGVPQQDLGDLYEAVRRQALRVDDKIDQVLG